MVRAILTNFSMIAQSLVLETGTSNSLGRATNNQATNNESFRTEWSLPEAGLRPSTPYYFRLKAQTGNGTVSSSCSSGETGIGWTCEPGGGKMIFTLNSDRAIFYDNLDGSDRIELLRPGN